MMISVTERTREIGVRKALGATRGIILWQFLVEAATLTAIGAMIGLLGGWALAAIVRTATPVAGVGAADGDRGGVPGQRAHGHPVRAAAGVEGGAARPNRGAALRVGRLGVVRSSQVGNRYPLLPPVPGSIFAASARQSATKRTSSSPRGKVPALAARKALDHSGQVDVDRRRRLLDSDREVAEAVFHRRSGRT